MDDDRLRTLLLDLYEEGAQDPPPMPRPAPAPVRVRRDRWRWLLPAGAGVALAGALAAVFVTLPDGHRELPATAQGSAASSVSPPAALPSAASGTAQGRSNSADKGLVQAPDAASAQSSTCRPAQLQGSASASPNEHALVVSLRNTGAVSCALAGYPAVQLLSGDGQLALRTSVYGAQLTPGRTPVQRVDLAPGTSAHFVVAATACQGGSGSSITGLTYTIGGSTSAVVKLPATASRSTQFCAAGGTGGDVVSVGPFAPGAAP
jgi:hypothetical protein